MLNRFIDDLAEERIDLTHVINVGRNFFKQEASVTDPFLRLMTIHLLHFTICFSQITFCGKQCDRYFCVLWLLKDVLEPYVLLLERIARVETVANNEAVSSLAEIVDERLCKTISSHVLDRHIILDLVDYLCHCCLRHHIGWWVFHSLLISRVDEALTQRGFTDFYMAANHDIQIDCLRVHIAKFSPFQI